VTPEADLFACTFYRHLFRLDPSLRALFTATDFVKQRRMLLNMIGVMVQGLNRRAELTPMLRDLGQRHVGYGVKPEHYDTFRRALLAALEDRLGDDFTDDVRQAWETVYGWMRDTILAHNGSTWAEP
jgi:nitric oxide dioxygenase